MAIVKRLIVAVMIADNSVMQFLKRRFPTRYGIGGKCRMCGSCCKRILLKMTPGQMGSPFFRNLVIRWLSWLYDFYLLDIDLERNYLAFSCRHRGDDGRCLNYRWRPPICRNYPLLDYFEEPVFLPGCGYKPSPKSQ